jgi:DNA mismatch repair protein MutS2
MTVDEAIPMLESYLYRSYQSGLARVWVVHGKGTGTLRREVGRYLADHPLVKSFGPADRHHGGIGVTEVKLSDS